MNKFIQSFATQQLLPPWKAEGSTCWCFAVRLTERCVRNYLDDYFNAPYPPDPSPFRYEPLPTTQFGLIVVCRQERISSQPEGSDCLAHNEVYLAIPVHRCEDGPPPTQKVVWVQPFVFGDNPTVLFSTREIVGLAMAPADINCQAFAPNQLLADVEINGIVTFGPSACSELIPCMHVATGAVSNKVLGDFANENPDLGAFLKVAGESGFFAVPAPLQRGGAPKPCELNTLKQFRAVNDMEAAVYRAIVACRSTHSNVDNLVYFDPDKVEIDFTWSASVSEMLALFDIKPPPPTGYAPGSPDRASVRVELAYAFTSTVDFCVLKTLHTYDG